MTNIKMYNSRYHYYYHYDLSSLQKMTYHDYFNEQRQELTCWWSEFSFLEFWGTIPASWKLTTAFISITDTLFVLVIKYLVFEDNYVYDP